MLTPGTWGDYVDTKDTTKVTAYQRSAVVTFLSAVLRIRPSNGRINLKRRNSDFPRSGSPVLFTEGNF